LAEDLFQETWLAAARNVHRLREDSELLPWLYTIARNKQRNAIRFRLADRKRREELLQQPTQASPQPDQETDARKRAAHVARAFASLPEAYREVLLLAVVEGVSTGDLSKILDIREDAVRKRLSRARAELARLLDVHRDDRQPAPRAPLPTQKKGMTS
jgi:RNA polymerase sigma-70 factor (ECF subfamily)